MAEIPPLLDLLLDKAPYVFGGLLVESLLFGEVLHLQITTSKADIPFSPGVQFVLFCICFYLLVTRRNPASTIVLLSSIVMFVISVAEIVVSYRWALHDLPAALKLQMDVRKVIHDSYLKGYLYVSNNLIADAILTYRCYKVWNNRKVILISAGTALVADSIWGYSSMKISIFSLAGTFTHIFFWSVFAFNVVMTLATAGRIWWVARTVGPHLGDNRQTKRYRTAVAIILESGAIYPISVLIVAVIPLSSNYEIIFLLIVFRVVAIMPTLMIVQVQMSRNAEGKAQRQIENELSVVVSNQFSANPPSLAIPMIDISPTGYHFDTLEEI
ncbi:hypothetical protein C0995_012507 [Termitomyces sp. Mi166|nr:hypothetical protein C0995_012507 [Termitomyces sp. Mi166\